MGASQLSEAETNIILSRMAYCMDVARLHIEGTSAGIILRIKQLWRDRIGEMGDSDEIAELRKIVFELLTSIHKV